MHGATMVLLQSTLLASILLVQQADCQRGRGGNVCCVDRTVLAVKC